jgi:hypothetical protein
VIAYIHYTDNLPENVGGTAQGPYIRIRPKYKDDKGIHAHEMEHVRQWWVLTIFSAFFLLAGAEYLQQPLWIAIASVGVHGLLYTLIPKYRLWCEVQAYKAQQAHYEDDRTPKFAKWIATVYRLDVTPEEAEKLLRSP